jgi:hypothetical protein
MELADIFIKKIAATLNLVSKLGLGLGLGLGLVLYKFQVKL